MSEAQKYEGNLYKDKSKLSRKSVKISDSTAVLPSKSHVENAVVSRQAYVEDAPDLDSENAIAIVDAPPPAPSPPSAVPSQSTQPVNVFDFLVTDDTPNSSKVSLGGTQEQMRMIEHAPPLFEAGHASSSDPDDDEDLHEYDRAFEENGYSYGTDPIPVQTPAPRTAPNASRESLYELDGTGRKSTDKKRKRHQLEDLDLTVARRLSQEPDAIMADAPPVLHSGLTGGLTRLLSKSKFPPSPDYSGADNNTISPLNPLKRTKNPLPAQKERGRKSSSSLVRVRKVSSSRRASDESRPRKHHRPHHDGSGSKRAPKAIEYPPDRQLVLFRSRAELFMSFVTKGPESGHGCSVNKALKRYHRERGEQGLGLGKVEEEKELWKSLRLRRNERGEVVLLT